MKALYTFLFISFLTCCSAFAQSPKPTKTGFRPVNTGGIRAGVNLASISNISGSNIYIGFHGALYGESRTSERWGYGSEIAFTNQGVSAAGTTLACNYINVPLLANFYCGPLIFQGGGYGALLLSAIARRDGQTQDISGHLAGSDFGAVLGLKVLPAPRFSIGARYYWGIQNIERGLTGQYGAKAHNRNLEFSLGCNF